MGMEIFYAFTLYLHYIYVTTGGKLGQSTQDLSIISYN